MLCQETSVVYHAKPAYTRMLVGVQEYFFGKYPV